MTEYRTGPSGIYIITKKNLIITETKIVKIEGAEIFEAIGSDSVVYVPLKQFCDYFGIDWSSQLRRTTTHHFYPEYAVYLEVPGPDGERNQVCLPVDLIHGWLLGVNPDRVKNQDSADKIRRFQRVAHRAYQSSHS